MDKKKKTMPTTEGTQVKQNWVNRFKSWGHLSSPSIIGLVSGSMTKVTAAHRPKRGYIGNKKRSS